jgi:hypothetical protein
MNAGLPIAEVAAFTANGRPFDGRIAATRNRGG